MTQPTLGLNELRQGIFKGCSKCGLLKPLTSFYKHSGRKDGVQARCKACHRSDNKRYYETNGEAVRERERERRRRNPDQARERAKRWRQANPERAREAGRCRNIRLRYGLTVEEYEAILAQGCSICGSHARVHMDHDHATNAVRSALCQRCNTGLGNFDDDPKRLKLAVAYLDKHSGAGE